jgi:hypothetical protein
MTMMGDFEKSFSVDQVLAQMRTLSDSTRSSWRRCQLKSRAMQPDPHLDAAFAIFRDRLGTAAHLNLSADEPFASDNPPDVGGPLRSLVLYIQGEPLALLGLTTPAVAVDKAGLIAYLARRARDCDLDLASDLASASALDRVRALAPVRSSDLKADSTFTIKSWHKKQGLQA